MSNDPERDRLVNDLNTAGMMYDMYPDRNTLWKLWKLRYAKDALATYDAKAKETGDDGCSIGNISMPFVLP
jgi:hypothetical protein